VKNSILAISGDELKSVSDGSTAERGSPCSTRAFALRDHSAHQWHRRPQMLAQARQLTTGWLVNGAEALPDPTRHRLGLPHDGPRREQGRR
jgi:hypothetical protein